MNSDSLVMSIPEFARHANISRGLAYDLARKEALPIPVIRLGRRMVLSRRAVEKLPPAIDHETLTIFYPRYQALSKVVIAG